MRPAASGDQAQCLGSTKTCRPTRENPQVALECPAWRLRQPCPARTRKRVRACPHNLRGPPKELDQTRAKLSYPMRADVSLDSSLQDASVAKCALPSGKHTKMPQKELVLVVSEGPLPGLQPRRLAFGVKDLKDPGRQQLLCAAAPGPPYQIEGMSPSACKIKVSCKKPRNLRV